MFTTPSSEADAESEPQSIVDRVLPIDEFRFVMSSLNISGRRLVTSEDVEDMINAVDDGDGKLDFDEFVQLIQKRY